MKTALILAAIFLSSQFAMAQSSSDTTPANSGNPATTEPPAAKQMKDKNSADANNPSRMDVMSPPKKKNSKSPKQKTPADPQDPYAR